MKPGIIPAFILSVPLPCLPFHVFTVTPVGIKTPGPGTVSQAWLQLLLRVSAKANTLAYLISPMLWKKGHQRASLWTIHEVAGKSHRASLAENLFASKLIPVLFIRVLVLPRLHSRASIWKPSEKCALTNVNEIIACTGCALAIRILPVTLSRV